MCPVRNIILLRPNADSVFYCIDKNFKKSTHFILFNNCFSSRMFYIKLLPSLYRLSILHPKFQQSEDYQIRKVFQILT